MKWKEWRKYSQEKIINSYFANFFLCLHFHAFNVELKIYENIVNSKKLWSIEEETGIVQCKLIYFT